MARANSLGAPPDRRESPNEPDEDFDAPEPRAECQPITPSSSSVFIGQQMPEAALRARLDGCLLDERLAAADSRAWAALPNPFPAFRMEGESP